MGKFPHTEIILGGYGEVICKRHGKRARQICASARYKHVFGVGLDPNAKAADEWRLSSANGSSYKAAGVLSGVGGFRCDGLITDDLTKNRKEADSSGRRQDTYNAYIDDFRSRKKPRAWEVMIGTRWHEDETMGRILPAGYNGQSGYMECRDGNVWLVICLPAQCEREDDPLERKIGEYLWPEWFDEDFWNDKKVNPRTWASLYQQRPAPEEGVYFKKKDLKRYNDTPKTLNYYIAFDPAVTGEEEELECDDTAIEVWAVDEHARIYKITEWVQKATMDIWIAQLITFVQIYKPLECISESGVIRRASEPYIKREMQQRGIFAMFTWVTRNADKVAMARAYQAMTSAGQVYLPNDSVGDATESELLRFPTSKDNHRVDAGANLCLRLEALWAANPPKPSKPEGGILNHGIKISSIMPDRFPKKQSRWAKK